MSVTLELSPEEEARYLELAQQQGLSLSAFFQKLAARAASDAEVRQHNAVARRKLQELWEQQDREWEAMSEEERQKWRDDWPDFKASMNEWAMSNRRRFTEDD